MDKTTSNLAKKTAYGLNKVDSGLYKVDSGLHKVDSGLHKVADVFDTEAFAYSSDKTVFLRPEKTA